MGWNYLSSAKLQRCNRWSLGIDKYFHPTHYNGCNYLSMLVLKLIHVSIRGYCCIHFILSTCFDVLSIRSWRSRKIKASRQWSIVLSQRHPRDNNGVQTNFYGEVIWAPMLPISPAVLLLFNSLSSLATKKRFPVPWDSVKHFLQISERNISIMIYRCHGRILYYNRQFIDE